MYGEPERTPIEETAPTRPTSPYGASKLAVDTALTECARLHGFGAVSLRYFNVAGAQQAADGSWLAERHSPETHLIPNVLAAAAGGRGIQVFGDDYPTPDGTCVRDYIHVTDLADAHLRALGACEPGLHRIYNLGNGTGFSVREVIDVCREVTGHDIPVTVAPRRPGDPAILVASARRIQSDLGWQARRDLRAMVTDAWQAMQAAIHPRTGASEMNPMTTIGERAGVWSAPGRANLMGEHTDYNQGLVLPFAIAQSVTAAAVRRDDGMLVLRSRQAPAEIGHRRPRLAGSRHRHRLGGLPGGRRLGAARRRVPGSRRHHRHQLRRARRARACPRRPPSSAQRRSR